MCGIVGIYNPRGIFDHDGAARRIEEAVASLKHRGPDAQAVRWGAGGKIVLGHARLSILDLDPRANQPMASTDGKILITFNGEIYNFRDIREDLKKEGAQFKTECDTEVLIEGYRHWGIESLLSRLAGMFAFGLYDSTRKLFFLARDRSGKKPLFYRLHNGSLAFASELRAMKLLSEGKWDISEPGFTAYLQLKFVPSPFTLIQNVLKVPPGSYLCVGTEGSPAMVRYWSPLKRVPSISLTDETFSAQIEEKFKTAVSRRLVSDVPICLFLSGGVDSSLIAAFLNNLGVSQMSAYTIAYRDMPEFNETDYAREVARKFSLRHEIVTLTQQDVLARLEDNSLGLDEPISDWIWIPLDELSRRAHRDEFKVTLVGEGSDEIFFGYDSMMKGLKKLRSYRQPAKRLIAAAAAAALAPVYRRAQSGHRRFDRWRRAKAGEPIYIGSSVGFDRSQLHQICGKRLPSAKESLALDFLRQLHNDYQTHAFDPQDDINLLSYIEFFTKMSEVLLQRVDRITMLHSLEARSPFLDHELVEAAFALPGPLKLKGDQLKGALKEVAARHLPLSVVHRKKMGFSFPFREWLKGELGRFVGDRFEKSRIFSDGWINREMATDLLSDHRRGRRDNSVKLWLLFDLARWYDQWMS